MAEDTEEREILAGEHALGVLEGEELSAAQRLTLASREFADRVEWWSFRLGCMAEQAGFQTPREGVWPAIARRLDGETASPPVSGPHKQAARGFSAWTMGMAMAGAAAAAAAVVTLFLESSAPPGVPAEPTAPISGAAPGERLIAQTESDDGAISLVGIVDSDRGNLTLKVAGLEPGQGLAPELWVVPEGGAPQSLGIIAMSGTFTRPLSAEEQALLREGSALAITYEDPASAPHAAPGSDILIVGPLSQI